MINLFDLNKPQMESFFTHLGEKKFRATQVMKWIYHKGILNFDEMTDISGKFIEVLKKESCLKLPKIITKQVSKDGTTKWMLEVIGGSAIEMVFIPEKERGTLCISSQAGCIMACPFCSTAHEGFNRNLSTGEIIGQIWLAISELGFSSVQNKKITNVVMMGMGEPLLNYDSVVSACNTMMSDLGFGLSKRRVTVSTCGVVPRIMDLINDSDVSLAVSLHATNDELRNEIVPINKKYPLKDLLKACLDFTTLKTDRKRFITWEYVMLAGVNDSVDDAKQFCKLIKDIPSKINLIPFNEFPGTKYKQSSMEQIKKFQKVLLNKKMIATIRKVRGEDISAACGQLVGEVADKSRRERILVRDISKTNKNNKK